MNITSTFALLDVKAGRAALRRRLAQANPSRPTRDGISQEFEVEVTGVTVEE